MEGYQKLVRNNIIIHLLEIPQVIEQHHLLMLTQNEISRSNAIQHPTKKKEFIATKMLRTFIFGKREIQYTKIGAPYLENEGYISISHTQGFVGIAQCNEFKIGFDLEPIREKVLKVKEKFIGEEERILCDTSSLETLTKIWSGKEALYKLSGRKKIIFKDQLFLSPIGDNTWGGKMIFPDTTMHTHLTIERMNDFILSFNNTASYEK